MIIDEDEEVIVKNIREKLEAGIIKRLHSDAPLGILIKWRLDSSLVCAVAQKHLDKPIKTFAVGMETDPIDLKYAKKLVDYLGT